MRVVLDHCVDIRFRKLLTGHEVAHTKELGLHRVTNGELLNSLELLDFEVLLTVDKNIRFQTSFKGRKISLITFTSRFTALDDISPLAPALNSLLSTGFPPGSVLEIGPTKPC